jgi:hypothetical protein
MAGKSRDTCAAMPFERTFEQALGYFRREDPGPVLFEEWSACQNQGLHYSNGDSWDRMLRQAIDPVLSGRSHPGRPAPAESAGHIHAANCWKERFYQRGCDERLEGFP